MNNCLNFTRKNHDLNSYVSVGIVKTEGWSISEFVGMQNVVDIWLHTSKWWSLMYSQTSLMASDCCISLPSVPKNLASASDIATVDGAGSALSVLISVSTFTRLACDSSGVTKLKTIKIKEPMKSQVEKMVTQHPHLCGLWINFSIRK